MLQINNRDTIFNVFLRNPTEKFQLRELSRISKVATPSVKKYLIELIKENLVIKTIPKTNYPHYQANITKEFKQLKILQNIKDINEVVDFIDDSMQPDAIILFGSYSRGEDTEESDIDLFVLTSEKLKNLQKFENKLNKKINILKIENFKKLSNELKNNIANGILLRGYLKIWD